MELLKCCAAMLLLLVVWGAWRRTMLDQARDRLFDTRDGLRAWFLENGYGIEHPLYRELRGLLNSYLRSTERLRFVGLLYFSAKIPKEMMEEISRETDARYMTMDPKLAEYISEVRGHSGRIMQKYMLSTSTLFMGIVFCAAPVALLSAVKDGLHGFWKKAKQAIAKGLEKTAARPETLEAAAALQCG
jgi:hypothetical protein